MDQLTVFSWIPGTFWALLIPVATCAILIYAIERENNNGNNSRNGQFRPSIRKRRHRQFVVTSSSVIVVVEDVAVDEFDAK